MKPRGISSIELSPKASKNVMRATLWSEELRLNMEGTVQDVVVSAFRSIRSIDARAKLLQELTNLDVWMNCNMMAIDTQYANRVEKAKFRKERKRELSNK